MTAENSLAQKEVESHTPKKLQKSTTFETK